MKLGDKYQIIDAECARESARVMTLESWHSGTDRDRLQKYLLSCHLLLAPPTVTLYELSPRCSECDPPHHGSPNAIPNTATTGLLLVFSISLMLEFKAGARGASCDLCVL